MTLRIIGNASGALLILSLLISPAHAQSSSQPNYEKSHPVMSQEGYSRVLDIIFPRDDPDPSKTVFELILRFRPSFQSTSQIVIRRRVDAVEVVEYTSLDGNIYNKLNQALAGGRKEDAIEMAKSVRVKRRELRIANTLVKRWHGTFLDSLAGTTRSLKEGGDEFDKTGGSETILLDGTFYDLWYEQRLNKMTFSLYDIEIDTQGSDGEFKLVQWMNALRREISRLK